MKKENDKDVLIIGSGIGGLSSAIILLKLGYNVTVIEKNRDPGGMMRSYRRFGIDCPVGVHYLGSLDNDQPLRRIFDYFGVSSKLQLERMGIGGPIDRYIFDDFTFDLPAGLDAFEENLRLKFPEDNKQITAIMDGMKKVAHLMQSFAFLFGSSGSSSAFSSLELFNPMGDLLSQINCSRDLRSVLEVPCSWIGLPLEDCPAFYHHNVLVSYLLSSWRLKCSSSSLVDIFVSRIKELGGEIIPGDGAAKILTNNRIAQGVLLKSGRLIKANIIIAAVHPKTMLKILQEDSVKPSYIKRINQIEDTGGVFSVHLGIDAKAHEELPGNIFKLRVDKDGALTRLAFYQLRKTAKAETNLLTIIAPSRYEDWREWEDTLSGQRGDGYIQKKEKETEELVGFASDIFGQLKGVKTLDAYTPLTVRDWVDSPNGSTYGVLRSRSQLLQTASLDRTSVKGLYLAGQSILAPGILGTALGSLATVRNIVGSDVLKKDFM